MPPSRVDRWFRRLQLVSAAAFSLNHGANDAQKTMGIIAGVLFAAGYIHDVLHSVLGGAVGARGDRARHARRAAGASSTRWDRRSPSCSRSAASRRRPARRICAVIATQLGVPVSTTHAITGAIVGVGATRRLSAVRWGVAGQIVWAWVLTIPARRWPSPRRVRRCWTRPVSSLIAATLRLKSGRRRRDYRRSGQRHRERGAALAAVRRRAPCRRAARPGA